MVKAVYPPEARERKIEGTAVIKITVDESGNVENTLVSSGDPILAAACVDALRQWKFKPFIRGGKPVKVATSLPCNLYSSTDVPPLAPLADHSSRKDRESSNNTGVNANNQPVTESAPPDSRAVVLIRKVQASYPLRAETEEIQGQVLAKVLVAETGDVADVSIVSGNPVLAKAVLDAVRKWKFEPFIRNGKPVQVWTGLSYDFAFENRIVVDKGYDPKSLVTDPSTQILTVPAGVSRGNVLYQVQPVYPREARRARIQGTVVLAAIIGKDGKVKELHPVSGPPALVDAALGAVQQWRYRPYLKQGNPVEVLTKIIVNFQLR